MSEAVPKKELAIFWSLNEIINTIKDKENFEKISNFVKRKDPIDKNIPQWYFNFVESLSKLYDRGYTNAVKENKSLE